MESGGDKNTVMLLLCAQTVTLDGSSFPIIVAGNNEEGFAIDSID